MTKLYIILLAAFLILFNCADKNQSEVHDESVPHTHESTYSEGDSQNKIEIQNSEVIQAAAEDHNHLHISQDMIVKKGIKTEKPKLKSYIKKGKITGIVKENKKNTFLVHSKVSGYIYSLKKDFGDSINKNETLGIINSLEILKLKRNYTNSYLQYLNFKENFKRAEKLFLKKVIDKKEFINRKTEFESSMAEAFSNEAQLIDIGLSSRIIKKLKTGLKDSNKTIVKDFLSPYLYLRSPIEGKVILQNLLPGEYIENDKLLFKVSNLKNLWLEFNAKEDDLPFITFGQEIVIKRNSMEAQSYSGKIINIAQNVDQNIRTVKVRVEINNEKFILKPGMFVNGYYETKSIKKRIAIPEQSIVKVFGINGVFFKETDGFKFVPVKVIDSDFDGNVFVRGIGLDSKVVVSGAFYLKAEQEISSGTVDPHAGHDH